jgi:UDP-N-acetylmuramoylalanine--D-glutamate ligase
MDIKGKRITIIGAIRSGLGAARLVKRAGGIPLVSDISDSQKVLDSVKVLDQQKIEYEIGLHTERIYDCDLMIVSPGVPLDSPVILRAKEKNIRMIGEVEIAYRFCKGKIIGVTGTNGKTTTTALIEHVFNACGKKTYAAGNIGKAFSEISADVEANEFVSLELSSYQIDLTDKFKPDTAILLNITPDHLNRYENSFQKYIESKMRLFKNMGKDENIIVNKDDDVVMSSLPETESRKYYFSLKDEINDGCYYNGKEIKYRSEGIENFSFLTDELFIKGEHNIANSMASVIAAKIYGLDNKDIAEGLRTFKGVEHRLEYVRKIGGVRYINDSKATNVESVWYALRSFNEPIFLILGGQDSGNDYNKIKALVKERVKKIYAVGSSSDKIFNFFHKIVKVEVKATMEEVITTVNKEARNNDIVLLSPACKSFDMYTSFEHRGEVFKQAVMNL